MKFILRFIQNNQATILMSKMKEFYFQLIMMVVSLNN